MRNQKRIRGILAGILAAVCMAQMMPQAAAETAADAPAETDRRSIWVAFPTQEGMSFFGLSGKVTGYNYDDLEKISEYTGWEMEYVAYGSADGNEAVGSAISDLREGKVDLLGPLLKTAATEKLFEFPEHSYGTVYTTLCAWRTGNLRESNLHSQDPLRVGLWAQAETRNSEVLAYLNAENLSYENVYHDTADEQKVALAQGAVDVISSVSLSPIANSRIAAQFAPRPYYFASTKGNTDLVRTLDETIARIDQVDPNLQDTLYDTYFRVVNDAFVLSDSQKSVLNGMGTLRVLCAENAAPYAYSMEGAPSGMLVSIHRNFAGKAGLDLEYTFSPSGTPAWA